MAVEARLGLEGERDGLGRPLAGALLDARRDRDEVHGLTQPQHHGLNAILQEIKIKSVINELLIECIEYIEYF